MELHLGCGEIYLNGYVNIDYPSTNHTIQKHTVADKYGDITELIYPKSSIEIIELHHVFEHFPRAQAIALLFSWNSWLKDGGKVIIEVPDYEKMAKISVSRFIAPSIKTVALRHIFGSQEANWAIHYHGWGKRELKTIFELSGFDVEFKLTKSHTHLYNIIAIGRKSRSISKSESYDIAKQFLSRYLVDDSPTERLMLKNWLINFRDQIKKSWGK